MIHTIRVSKPAPLREYDKLLLIVPDARPKNVRWDNGILSYDYVDGVPATNVMSVWYAAQHAMWTGDPTPMCVDAYLSYMATKKPDISEWMRPRLVDLTPVRMCHGDLTLYNAIQKDGIVFIDPGDTHGLPCREMDESKMMQSMDGFGTLMRDLPPVGCWPRFNFKPAHFALLASHYVRMLEHVNQECQEFALQRIEELTCTHIS